MTQTLDTATTDFTSTSTGGRLTVTFHNLASGDVAVHVDRTVITSAALGLDLIHLDAANDNAEQAYQDGYDQAKEDLATGRSDVMTRWHDDHHGIGSAEHCYEQPCKDLREERDRG